MLLRSVLFGDYLVKRTCQKAQLPHRQARCYVDRLMSVPPDVGQHLPYAFLVVANGCICVSDSARQHPQGVLTGLPFAA